MKKIFLVCVLLLLSIIGKTNAQSIHVHIDTLANQAYVNIEPIEIGWLNGTPSVQRLYIDVNRFNLINNAGFKWQLKYPVIIDNTTNNWTTIFYGDASLPVRSNVTIDQATQGLFLFVADSTNLNIRIID